MTKRTLKHQQGKTGCRYEYSSSCELALVGHLTTDDKRTLKHEQGSTGCRNVYSSSGKKAYDSIFFSRTYDKTDP